jgi:protein-tyrosine-phosphatase
VRRPVRRPVRPDLVLVCRANRARSPVAAALFRQYADDQHLDPKPVITSSGLYALRGQSLLSSMQAALTRKKRDELDHRSKPFSLHDADTASLVITFERELTRAVVSQNPALVPRTFTLREIVRLTKSSRWNPAWNGAPDVAARLHVLRPLVEPGDDDTPDPATGGRRIARRVLDSLVDDVALVAPVVLGHGSSHSEEPDAAAP